MEFEKTKGFTEITKAVNEMLRMEEDNQSNEIIAHIKTILKVALSSS